MLLLAIIMPILASSLSAWYNTIIKFAPDANHAKGELKKMFVNIFLILGHLYTFGFFVWQLIFPEPLTVSYIMSLVLPLVTLSVSLTSFSGTVALNRLIKSIVKRDKEIVDILQKLNNDIEKLSLPKRKI